MNLHYKLWQIMDILFDVIEQIGFSGVFDYCFKGGLVEKKFEETTQQDGYRITYKGHRAIRKLNKSD